MAFKQMNNDLMREERPFNMALHFLDRLNNLLGEANQASIEGDLLKWFRVLRVIYRAVHFKLIEKRNDQDNKEKKRFLEELKSVEDAFKEVKEMVEATFSASSGMAKKEIFKLNYSDLEVKLDELETKLNDLMGDNRLILPRIDKKRYDENIKKFLDIYIKKSVMKDALKNINTFKEVAPDLYEKLIIAAVEQINADKVAAK